MDHAVCVHVDFLGGRNFGQAGHFHHVAAQGDDEACAGGNGDAAHGNAEAFGAAKSLALSLREYWVFAMQTGILSKPSFSSEAISAAASALKSTSSAPYTFGDGADFVFDAQLDIVGEAEFVGLVVRWR